MYMHKIQPSDGKRSYMHTRDDYSDIVMTTLSDDCEIICTSLFCDRQGGTLGEHVSTQNRNILLNDPSSKDPTPKHWLFQITVFLKITD